MLGELELTQEQQIVLETKQWLEEKSTETTVYQRYLSHWGDWKNPWEESPDQAFREAAPSFLEPPNNLVIFEAIMPAWVRPMPGRNPHTMTSATGCYNLAVSSTGPPNTERVIDIP